MTNLNVEMRTYYIDKPPREIPKYLENGERNPTYRMINDMDDEFDCNHYKDVWGIWLVMQPDGDLYIEIVDEDKFNAFLEERRVRLCHERFDNYYKHDGKGE